LSHRSAISSRPPPRPLHRAPTPLFPCPAAGHGQQTRGPRRSRRQRVRAGQGPRERDPHRPPPPLPILPPRARTDHPGRGSSGGSGRGSGRGEVWRVGQWEGGRRQQQAATGHQGDGASGASLSESLSLTVSPPPLSPLHSPPTLSLSRLSPPPLPPSLPIGGPQRRVLAPGVDGQGAGRHPRARGR
jgi:hypothetical protein